MFQTRHLALVVACAAFAAGVQAAEAPQLTPAQIGKNVFSAQCGLCHSAAPNDNGGAQGPSLHGVLGRAAAGGDFSYSQAMKDSKLTWDTATLDKFLASPTTVVPGSAMVVPIADATERANVIAYFSALADGSYQDPPRRGGFPGAGGPPPAAAAPTKGSADWKNDAPGRMHRIDVSTLPPPFDTASANNFPRVVPKPAGAELKLPAGFKVDVFTTELVGPRTMRIAPNGDIFVAETQTGRVKVIKPSADGSKPATITTFAQGLQQPFGLQFYPAANPEWLYVAENNRVVRYPYKSGEGVASSVPEIVVPKFSNGAGGHYTRDLQFSPDGKRMFVSVGSASNVADQMEPKPLAEAQAWDKQKGVTGAAWGPEENRASVMVFDMAAPATSGKLYATGIRNCVGLSMQPATGDLWCSTNERDMLGDDLVPDYSTRVQEGGFYGWPWYYLGNHEDPREHVKGQRPDLAGKAIVPDVPYTAHSAAVALAFYDAKSGASQFPAEYQGAGFAVLHGSWNRAFRTGAKIVRVVMKDNVPTGEYEDFMTGFIVDDASVWGRPNSIVVAADGSLLVGDDGANVIYRISTAK